MCTLPFLCNNQCGIISVVTLRRRQPVRPWSIHHIVLDLESALAETFGVRLSEVDEMIMRRFEAEDRNFKWLWP
jgi:hypothetical protein